MAMAPWIHSERHFCQLHRSPHATHALTYFHVCPCDSAQYPTNIPHSLTKDKHRVHQERNDGGNGHARHGMYGPEGNPFCPRISCAFPRPANEVIDTSKQEDSLVQFKQPHGIVVSSTKPETVSLYNEYSIASSANYIKDTTTQTPPIQS